MEKLMVKTGGAEIIVMAEMELVRVGPLRVVRVVARDVNIQEGKGLDGVKMVETDLWEKVRIVAWSEILLGMPGAVFVVKMKATWMWGLRVKMVEERTEIRVFGVDVNWEAVSVMEGEMSKAGKRGARR